MPIVIYSFPLWSHHWDSCVSQPLHSAGPDRGSALLRSGVDYEEEVGCLCVLLCVCVCVCVCTCVAVCACVCGGVIFNMQVCKWSIIIQIM